MKCCRYEDLISKPESAISALMRHFGLPEELASVGKKALEQDSQANSHLSASKIGGLATPRITSGRVKRIDEVLKVYKLPPHSHLINLQGVLDC